MKSMTIAALPFMFTSLGCSVATAQTRDSPFDHYDNGFQSANPVPSRRSTITPYSPSAGGYRVYEDDVQRGVIEPRFDGSYRYVPNDSIFSRERQHEFNHKKK
jgi:hypothetical protein